MLPVIGYARVSSQGQASDGISLEAQRARIESWAEATDATLIEVIEDAAISGSRSLADRPGGQRVDNILNQRNPEVDAVVVTRLDRLGRNAAENLSYLRRFANGKVGLVSILDRLDLSTPAGRCMAAMTSIFGELERDLIAERTSEALAQLRAEGRAYGPTPYGFRRDGDFLVPDENEDPVVREILEMRLVGHSFRVIADRLNAESIPAKRGGKWSPMAVRSVCRTQERRQNLVA